MRSPNHPARFAMLRKSSRLRQSPAACVSPIDIEMRLTLIVLIVASAMRGAHTPPAPIETRDLTRVGRGHVFWCSADRSLR
jgi:hypothetical protein